MNCGIKIKTWKLVSPPKGPVGIFSQELNNFTYSVLYHLRAPLRCIDGLSQALINEYLDQLDDTGANYLRRGYGRGAQDMENLIDDLLKLSRISRREPELEQVNLSELAKTVFDDLIEQQQGNQIDLQVEADLWGYTDPGLADVVLTNLLSNAIEFSSKEPTPLITVGKTSKEETNVFFVQDNGVGFDPRFLRLLTASQPVRGRASGWQQ